MSYDPDTIRKRTQDEVKAFYDGMEFAALHGMSLAAVLKQRHLYERHIEKEGVVEH